MIITTSSKEKIREIKELFPTIEVQEGDDILEVFGTIDEVITYKALKVNPGYIVEDTILNIDGKDIIDIKYKMDILKENMKVNWIVSLGYHTKYGKIKVYRGEVEGIITLPDIIPENSYKFDCMFKPLETGLDKTLHELKLEKKKNKYSPRYKALENLVKDNFIFEKDISDIPEWNGKYQTL